MSRPDSLRDLLDQLSRKPDVTAADLYAVDGVDRLLLEQVESLAGPENGPQAGPEGQVVVVGDGYGALTLGAAWLTGRPVRVWQDSVLSRRALARNAAATGLSELVEVVEPGTEPYPSALFADAALVLVRLPRALVALDELLEALTRAVPAGVRVLAAGRDKDLVPAVRERLDARFGSVVREPGKHKAHVFTLTEPVASGASTFPRAATIGEFDLEVRAHGGVFAGTELDLGTRQLLEAFEQLPDAARVLDLGCGTGLLAAAYARAHPSAEVFAADISAAAVDSARATAAANGLSERVTVVYDDDPDLPDASLDLVLLNPPFHVGAAVHAGAAERMFAVAARLLRPGGQLWTVYNGHLKYASELARVVGRTKVRSTSRRFAVTASVRRGPAAPTVDDSEAN